MPCENCNVQFTFLKRKRNCSECSRFYCSQCLEKRTNNIYLCERCVIFTTRPISKVDLLKLKPKDLIFYLQSKHISTAGCVEKEELVNLVLAHVNSDNGQQIPNTDGFPGHDSTGVGFDNNCSNPFDQFKQSCQNFFSNFTGKIGSDFNFETRTATDASNVQVNISDQPRVSTREIPTYASSINVNVTATSQQNCFNSVPNINVNRSPSGQGSNFTETNTAFYRCPKTETSTASHVDFEQNNVQTNVRDANSSSSLSSPSSPVISISSLSSHSLSSQCQAGRVIREKLTIPQGENTASTPISPNTKRVLEELVPEGSGSGCECSDDEIITKFQKRNRTQCRHSQIAGKASPPSQTDSAFEDQIPGPSGSVPESSSTSKSSSVNPKNSGGSSGSSFEELGAMGGGSPSDIDNWQFVNKTEMTGFEEPQRTSGNASQGSSQNSEIPKNQTFQSSNDSSNSDQPMPERKRPPRRMVRRRSDSSIYTQKRAEHDLSPFPLVSEESDGEHIESLHKRQRKSCKKCGKNKKNLEKCLAKFIRQLQSSQMSRDDIRREANAFLVYLRDRQSFDCSDSESNDIEKSNRNQEAGTGLHRCEMNRSNSIVMETQYGANDGIHVYAHDESDNGRHDNRFMNLWDIKSSFEIDELSVKQLKEILMLNRVDYKGCCEKQELLERVHRLWKDLKTSPAVDKLGVDDLCKICMDAPIECVMLECGHMATCTNCGKVLSECPICRQYVVRVVRFFKA